MKHIKGSAIARPSQAKSLIREAARASLVVSTAAMLVFGCGSIDDGRVEPPEPVASVSLAVGGPALSIDWNDARQTIDGFGASGAFGMADKVMAMPTTPRNEILDKLFSTTTGAGLTIIRNQVPNIKPASSYDFTADAGQAAFVDAALLRSSAIKIIATVWSPPAYMKSNSSEYGGYVPSQYWSDFSFYIGQYVQHYAMRGTPLYGISPANEPDTATSYPSALWSGNELRDFLSGYAPGGNIIIPENSYWSEENALPSLADPAAALSTFIVAGHGYSRATNPNRFTTAEAAGKKVWQTEMCTMGAPQDLTINDGITEAQRVYEFLWEANANAFLHWWFATDKVNTRESLIDITTSTYTVAKRLWTLGNYARFIRPGWVRIGARGGDMRISAFKEVATGKFAVVVVNSNYTSKSISLKMNGFTAASVTPYTTSATQDLVAGTAISTTSGYLDATVPSRSVVTYTGTSTGTTSQLAATITETMGWTGQATSAGAGVKIKNAGATSASGTVTITAPAGVTASPTSQSFGPIAAGGSVSFPVTLNIASTASPGAPLVLASASLTNGTQTVVGANLIRIYKTNHTINPNTNAEKPWLYDAGGSQFGSFITSEDGNSRFADGTATFTYKIQLPANITGGTIDLDIANSFKVDTSTNGTTWTNRLLQSPAVTNESNRAYRSLNVNTIRGSGTVVYIRVGDSFPTDGWGGTLYHLRFALTRP